MACNCGVKDIPRKWLVTLYANCGDAEETIPCDSFTFHDERYVTLDKDGETFLVVAQGRFVEARRRDL